MNTEITHTAGLVKLLSPESWKRELRIGRTLLATLTTQPTIDQSQVPQVDANARRLVAAWNYCDGINTESLENNKALPHITQALDDSEHALKRYETMLRELATARAQADALRNAARVASEALDMLADNCTPGNEALTRVFNRVIEETGATAALTEALHFSDVANASAPVPGESEAQLRDIVSRLVKWAEVTGGWEAPVWAEAQAMLAGTVPGESEEHGNVAPAASALLAALNADVLAANTAPSWYPQFLALGEALALSDSVAAWKAAGFVPDDDGAPIHRYLDLSTGHLDEATGRAMADGESIPADGYPTVICLSINSRDDSELYGHIVPVLALEEGEGESEAEWPQCVRDCFARARALNCDYIRFDRDGQIDNALPVYDWEGDEEIATDESRSNGPRV